MLSIGEFARLGDVSVRMLRHYDDLGLLCPAQVNEWTGHRRYEVSQLRELNRIVALKELGFTLAQVGGLLRDGVADDELRGMLRSRRAELEQQVHDTRHRIAQVDARLRLIESEYAMSESDIVVKHIEPMRIAALTDITRFGVSVEDLFIQACDAVDAAGLPRTSPMGWFVPDPSVSDDAVRVHAGFTVTGDAPGLEFVALPAVEVATVIHHGPMASIAHVHQTLARWAESRGHETGDTARNSRWVFLEANGQDQTDWIVEVQLELT